MRQPDSKVVVDTLTALAQAALFSGRATTILEIYEWEMEFGFTVEFGSILGIYLYGRTSKLSSWAVK